MTKLFIKEKIRMIGMIFAFAGGLIALFSSLSYFFEGELLSHLNYNKPDSVAGEITIVGIIIFLIGITTLVLTLLGKKHQSKKISICIIILGAILLAILPFVGEIYVVFTTFIASLLILAGGIISDISYTLE